MGNSQQIIHTVTLIDLNEWKQVGIHRQTCRIIRNQQRNIIAQLQSIPFNPKNNLQKQIEIYQYRKSQTMALVTCLGVTYEKKDASSLCGSNHILKVITQRIPFRLSQLQQISFPQAIYVLSESLRGYKDCFSKLGSFYIDDQMIGINTEGETKVWVNQNFAQNHPAIQKPLLQTSGSEIQKSIDQNFQKSKQQTDMVENIIKIIQKKCQNGHFPASFRQKIYPSPLTFDQAFKQIENFVKLKGIFVPDRIFSQILSAEKLNGTTLMTENPDQRVKFISPTSPVSHKLVVQTQKISQRLSSPFDYPLKQSQQRSHSPIRILFQRPHQMTGTQRISNHIPQVRSIPIKSKVIFRFLSPENPNKNFQ